MASWETSLSTDIRNPKFNEVFRIVILERKLFTKTLQVNIWCLQDNGPDECAVSLLFFHKYLKIYSTESVGLVVECQTQIERSLT